MLGTIAFAEGTHAHYNDTFAYRTFSSYRDHPRIRVCAGGYCSTAAGRYQILSGTWSGIRSGLSDFSPRNQDQAALRLIRDRGVTNIDGIDTYDELAAAIRQLNRGSVCRDRRAWLSRGCYGHASSLGRVVRAAFRAGNVVFLDERHYGRARFARRATGFFFAASSSRRMRSGA